MIDYNKDTDLHKESICIQGQWESINQAGK